MKKLPFIVLPRSSRPASEQTTNKMSRICEIVRAHTACFFQPNLILYELVDIDGKVGITVVDDQKYNATDRVLFFPTGTKLNPTLEQTQFLRRSQYKVKLRQFRKLDGEFVLSLGVIFPTHMGLLPWRTVPQQPKHTQTDDHPKCDDSDDYWDQHDVLTCTIARSDALESIPEKYLDGVNTVNIFAYPDGVRATFDFCTKTGRWIRAFSELTMILPEGKPVYPFTDLARRIESDQPDFSLFSTQGGTLRLTGWVCGPRINGNHHDCDRLEFYVLAGTVLGSGAEISHDTLSTLPFCRALPIVAHVPQPAAKIILHSLNLTNFKGVVVRSTDDRVDLWNCIIVSSPVFRARRAAQQHFRKCEKVF